jgi:hypothetical protein
MNGQTAARGEKVMTDKPGTPGASQAPDSARSRVDEAQIQESTATKRAMWIALGSLLLALISAGATIFFTVKSTNLVKEQNSNAQQQELVSLVTDIEQGQQAATSPNGSSAALTVLGEAEEADNIIASLHSNVSSPEKYIVGMALEDGQDFKPALTLLKSAAMEASDPRTTADAWRGEAAILYKLSMNPQAEGAISKARESFGGKGKDVTLVGQDNNIAFTDLFDVPYQASIGQCSVAENKEWDTAAQLIRSYYYQHHHYHLLGGNNAKEVAANARRALRKTCKVQAGVLKANKILALISS